MLYDGNYLSLKHDSAWQNAPEAVPIGLDLRVEERARYEIASLDVCQ